MIITAVCAVVYMGALFKGNKGKNSITVTTSMYLRVIGLGLTFTGLHALKPPVSNVSVAGTSAVLVPSTARSATTASAGFLERAAL